MDADDANLQYGFTRTLSLPFETAVQRATEELKAQGFGVLTTIDVKETLKKKLNVEFTKYVILGACNPPLAHRALGVDMNIGLLLPCNVIVYEKNGKTVVGAFDPMMMVPLVGKAELGTIAAEVRKKLESVLAAL
jgi:uncharacterized protein (DUF302 family)